MKRNTSRETHKVINLGDYIRSKAEAQIPGDGRQSREARRGRHKTRMGALILLCVIIFLTLSVLVGLDIFSVDNIEVLGTYYMPLTDIVALTGITKGENIFAVDISRVEKNLKSNSLIELTSVKRIYPNTIRIELNNRVPFAVIPYLNNYIIIDENSTVVEVAAQLPGGNYPLIKGVSVTGYDLGAPIIPDDNISFENALDTCRAFADAGAIGYAREIRVENVDRVSVLTYEGMVMELGKADELDKKAAHVAQAMPELYRRGFTSGVLYVSALNGAVYSDMETSQKYVYNAQTQEQGEQDPG